MAAPASEQAIYAHKDGPGDANPSGRVSARVANLAHGLTRSARRFPALPALVQGERIWTWAQIDQASHDIAAALAARGVGKGDRVLVHSKNCEDMFSAMFAVFRLGAIWTPTNFRLTPDEVVALAQDSGAVALLCHADFPDHAAAVAKGAPTLRFVWTMGGPAAFGESTLADRRAAHAGARVADAVVDRDDPCWFFFTSGTTGRSKAAVLTHGHMAFIVTNHLSDLLPGVTEKDASLVVAPLSHGAGVHQLNLVYRGAPTILMPTEHFDIAQAWRLVQDWKVSNIFTVPTILKMLVEHPSRASVDHSSLKHVIYAGAPMYRADQITALKALGPAITQYFGLGEVTGCITVFPGALHEADDGPAARIGTCGFERTGVEVSIQSDEGKALAPFETGEICVIGPAVFAGYWNNPEANAKSFRDGWFRTGDLGHLDDEGFLYITGRASDMYISGGSNIYPREIEEKILAHPDIAEAAVLGVPDPLWGEVGVAVCVARAGASVTADDLYAFLAPKLPRYKAPRRILFWEALPKSGYGKVPKRMIRDELARRDAETGEPA